MRNTVSHLLSRLLNSGAAFDAPHARQDRSRHDTTPQTSQAPQTRQHGEPKAITPTKKADGAG